MGAKTSPDSNLSFPERSYKAKLLENMPSYLVSYMDLCEKTASQIKTNQSKFNALLKRKIFKNNRFPSCDLMLYALFLPKSDQWRKLFAFIQSVFTGLKKP